jgi:small subunit ribosomal protein S14
MNRRNKLRDRSRRKLVDQYSVERALIKSMGRDGKSDVAKNALRTLPRDSSPARVVNRCTVTGFARSERRFGLSRYELRRHCRQGLLSGITKAVW